MTTPISPLIANTVAPPVMEARRWLADAVIPPDRPLLNLSQAAPVDPPLPEMRAAMARAILEETSAHLYGPVLGRPDLRAALAAQVSALYAGRVEASDIAITSGCNEAFCATIQTLAAPGDAVLLPLPWYFNHKMWLDMSGVEARLLPPGPGMIPDPAEAARLIDDRVKAIALVTPNNPTGAEYPPETLRAFRDLAREKGIALILDETYRDFHAQEGAPHDLFADPDWRETLIHLYSFSKAYRLTGHRIGAIVAAPERLAHVEKFLDTMTICPSQVGQAGALYGITHLTDWVAGERREILSRRAALEAAFATLPGWEVLCAGAYFAFVRHPFDIPSNELAQRLVQDRSILVLPGTMFGRTRAEGGDGSAEQTLRIAFANADAQGIATLRDRLAGYTPV